ncbi:MAG: hypothetical protein AAFQ91_28095 [Cyanobacteria bacterium J06621_15]
MSEQYTSNQKYLLNDLNSVFSDLSDKEAMSISGGNNSYSNQLNTMMKSYNQANQEMMQVNLEMNRLNVVNKRRGRNNTGK